MKKVVLALSLAAAASAVLAEDTVNYGDPLASYSGLGIQQSFARDNMKNTTASFVYGGGSHIFSGDLGSNFKGDINYRARYFNVDQESGFGWSVDALGGKVKSSFGTSYNNTVLAGVVQKFDITDSFIVVPMVYGGKAFINDKDKAGKKSNNDSWLGQGGVYVMYGFEAGHWVYANPKSTYLTSGKKWHNALELGAGYMLTENQSLGAKYELSKLEGSKSDSKATINYFFYF